MTLWLTQPLANVNDSSCYYESGCDAAVPYYIPNECFEWVINVDEYCCNNTWDASCQELYSYCLDGWSGPTDVQNIDIRGLEIYPNPTTGVVRVNKLVDVIVYDMTGKKVTDEKEITIFDLSSLDNGIYNLYINYKGLIINRRIKKGYLLSM